MPVVKFTYFAFKIIIFTYRMWRKLSYRNNDIFVSFFRFITLLSRDK